MLFIGNIEIGKLQNNHHRLNTLDDDALSKLVADRLDLPFSKYLLKGNKFQQSIIKHCWMDQLRLKGKNKEIVFFFASPYFFFHLDDDFVNDCDLYIACQIRQKQIELIDRKKTNIIIPSIALKDIYDQRQISLLNNSKQTYSGKKKILFFNQIKFKSRYIEIIRE